MGASTAVRVAGGYKVYNTEGGEADTSLHIGRFGPTHREDEMSYYEDEGRGSRPSYFQSSSSSKRQLGRSSSSSSYYADVPVRRGQQYDDEAYCEPSYESRERRRAGLPPGHEMTREFRSRSASYASRGSTSGSRSTNALLHSEQLERMSTEDLAGLISSAARNLAQRP